MKLSLANTQQKSHISNSLQPTALYVEISGGMPNCITNKVIRGVKGIMET
jgi:hypothetical protein